jgi:hypothetical protein
MSILANNGDIVYSDTLDAGVGNQFVLASATVLVQDNLGNTILAADPATFVPVLAQDQVASYVLHGLTLGSTYTLTFTLTPQGSASYVGQPISVLCSADPTETQAFSPQSVIPETLIAMRKRFGITINYLGTSYPAIVKSIGEDSPDYIPAGPGGNSLFTDERVFSVTPSDFGTRPVAGDTIIFDAANYIVLGVRAIMYSSIPVAWRIICYRQTTPKPTSNDAAQAAKWTIAP